MIPALWLAANIAATPRVEAHYNAGLTAHLGGAATNVNVGAGVGIRLEHRWLGTDATLGMGLGIAPWPSYYFMLGIDASYPGQRWRPTLGLELDSLWGRPLVVLDSNSGQTPYAWPFVASVRLRLHPLVLRRGRCTFNVMGLAAGPGFDGGTSYRVQFFQFRVSLGGG
jgi:hypothetical protein